MHEINTGAAESFGETLMQQELADIAGGDGAFAGAVGYAAGYAASVVGWLSYFSSPYTIQAGVAKAYVAAI